MELELHRYYHATAVNGVILLKEKELCKTIELPYRNNAVRISCIPEGRYEIRKRYSPKFKHHFEIQQVTGRSFILIHPANNASKELRGCIAPVLVHTGIGKGSSSRTALSRLKNHLYPVLESGEPVYLTIKSML